MGLLMLFLVNGTFLAGGLRQAQPDKYKRNRLFPPTSHLSTLTLRRAVSSHPIRAMPATILATKAALQQKLFGENIKAIINVVFTHIRELFFQFIQALSAKAVTMFQGNKFSFRFIQLNTAAMARTDVLRIAFKPATTSFANR